jgi:hypothetical protein
MYEQLHYEKTSRSAVFALGRSFDQLLRKRASHSNDYDHNPRDDGHPTDSDATDDDNALLIPPPARGEGTLKACPFLRFLRLLGCRFSALRFFFCSLADHRRDGLKFFAGPKIH